jgi:hypothetical protein
MHPRNFVGGPFSNIAQNIFEHLDRDFDGGVADRGVNCGE